jgi:hypothetical protein
MLLTHIDLNAEMVNDVTTHASFGGSILLPKI